MKKSNKILALLLVLILAASCIAFTACNKNEPDPEVAKGAYIFSDKATYLNYKNNAAGDKIPNLKVLYENDASLKNTYTMIAVNNEATFLASTANPDGTYPALTGTALTNAREGINADAADIFVKWMSLSSTRSLINNYGNTFGTSYGESLFTLLETAQTYEGTVEELKNAADALSNKTLRIASTTSVRDSGLMQNVNDATKDCLVKSFEDATGIEVEAVYVGTGAAINAAKFGNADVIIVHSKSQETAFCSAGFGRTVEGLSGTVVDADNPSRVSFMYNFFVLIGSKDDPADVANAATAKDAFKLIADGGYNFISRGDKSGTHTAELKLWDSELGITAEAASFANYPWYISAASGMGACLTMANEKLAIGE